MWSISALLCALVARRVVKLRKPPQCSQGRPYATDHIHAGIPCVGVAGVLDTHKPDNFTVRPFSALVANTELQCRPASTFAFRRFRPALETAVELTGIHPHFVRLWKRGRRVFAASGPWCSSGHWWNRSLAWARDEWDVALNLPSGIGLYRIYLDRMQSRWFVEGMFD